MKKLIVRNKVMRLNAKGIRVGAGKEKQYIESGK